MRTLLFVYLLLAAKPQIKFNLALLRSQGLALGLVFSIVYK